MKRFNIVLLITSLVLFFALVSGVPAHAIMFICGDTAAAAAGGVPDLASYATSTGSTSSLTIAAPAGIASGDLLVAIVGNDATNPGDCTFSDNVTDWTFGGCTGSSSSDSCVALYYKTAGSSEGAVTVTSTVSVNWGFFLRVTGADTSDVVNASLFENQSGRTSHIITAVTTDADDCLVLFGFSYDGSDGTPYTVSGTGWGQVGSTLLVGDSSGVVGQRDQESLGAGVNAGVATTLSDGSAHFQLAINSGS